MSIYYYIIQIINNFNLRSSTPAINTLPLVTLVELLSINSYLRTTGGQIYAKPLHVIFRTVIPV